ncbi:TPA: DUF805 domain-containing protein [Morganella morganii]|nr:DUF805 domain-containing protein [Morganella morganii]
MTLQQWAFSFHGRIGRKAFWAGIGVCGAVLFLLMSLQGLFKLPVEVIMVPVLMVMYPAAAIFTKRLHDRNKRGGWALMLVMAWALTTPDWSLAGDFWQWGLGHFLPIFIVMIMVLDCGVFKSLDEGNRFGESTQPVDKIDSH